jgi:hypothetical protein
MPKKVFWTSLQGLLTAAATLISTVVAAIGFFQHSCSAPPKSVRVTPVTTIGVFRPANTQLNQTTEDQWLLRNNNAMGSADISFLYGRPGDIPVVGDWTGKGTTTIGVFRPAGTQFNQTTEGRWLLRNSNTSGDPEFAIPYGAPGDVPVVGDWTGKGKTTIGVFRPANTQFNQTTECQWLLRTSDALGSPDVSFFYGRPGDIPVVGDWTGKGKTTIGVFRPAGTQFNQTTEGRWLLRNSNTAGSPDISLSYGGPGDLPVVGDWTGKGKTTIGVFSPASTQFSQTTDGRWLLRNSNTPGSPEISFSYGGPRDVPVVGHWSGSSAQSHP